MDDVDLKLIQLMAQSGYSVSANKCDSWEKAAAWIKNNWYIIAENMLRVARESIVEERDGEWSDSVTAYLRDRGYDYGGPINTVLNLIRARLTREPSKKEQIEALKDLLYRDQSNEIWQPENHKEKPECFRAINYRILEAYRRGLQQAETRKP